jgi:hypothetical protein
MLRTHSEMNRGSKRKEKAEDKFPFVSLISGGWFFLLFIRCRFLLSPLTLATHSPLRKLDYLLFS